MVFELPHLFHEAIPNAKFIVILRNSTSRLYWFNLPEQVKNTSLSGPKIFHELVEKQNLIQHFNECMRKYDNGMVHVCIKQQLLLDAQVAFDWQNIMISRHHNLWTILH